MSILLTEREVAAELRVSRNTLRDRIRPELPIVRIGRAYRYPREAVEEWVKRSQAPASAVEPIE